MVPSVDITASAGPTSERDEVPAACPHETPQSGFGSGPSSLKSAARERQRGQGQGAAATGYGVAGRFSKDVTRRRAQVPDHAEPRQHLEDVVAEVDLPPEEALVGGALVVVVVVVPALPMVIRARNRLLRLSSVVW